MNCTPLPHWIFSHSSIFICLYSIRCSSVTPEWTCPQPIFLSHLHKNIYPPPTCCQNIPHIVSVSMFSALFLIIHIKTPIIMSALYISQNKHPASPETCPNTQNISPLRTASSSVEYFFWLAPGNLCCAKIYPKTHTDSWICMLWSIFEKRQTDQNDV